MKADPNYTGVHSGLAVIYWKLGQLDAAEAEFRAELSRVPHDPTANCLLGQVLLLKNDTAGAAKSFEAAIAGNPSYRDALFGLGKAELNLGHPEQAVDPLRRAIELDPNSTQAHFVLGTALRRLGKTAEGVREQKLSEQIHQKQDAEYFKQHPVQTDPSRPQPPEQPR